MERGLLLLDRARLTLKLAFHLNQGVSTVIASNSIVRKLVLVLTAIATLSFPMAVGAARQTPSSKDILLTAESGSPMAAVYWKRRGNCLAEFESSQKVESGSGRYAAAAPDGTIWIMADNFTQRITQFDASFQELKTIEIHEAQKGGAGIRGICFDANGTLYVTGSWWSASTNRVLRIDAAASPHFTSGGAVVLAEWYVPFEPADIAWNPKDGNLYCTAWTLGAGNVYQLNPASGAVTQTYTIPGLLPSTYLKCHDFGQVLVIGHSDNKIYVFEPWLNPANPVTGVYDLSFLGAQYISGIDINAAAGRIYTTARMPASGSNPAFNVIVHVDGNTGNVLMLTPTKTLSTQNLNSFDLLLLP